MLGILDVNGWHNVVHIVTGALGLLVASSYSGSRAYALGLGAIYLVVALLGFLAGDGDEEVLNLIPVNTEDNLLHLLIGLAGVGGASPRRARHRRARSAPRLRRGGHDAHYRDARWPDYYALLAAQPLLEVVGHVAQRALQRLKA